MRAANEMGGLGEAAARMITYVKTVEPDPALADAYRDIYGRFLTDMQKLYGVEV